MPQTLSVITSIFPSEKRGAAFGAWSAVAGLSAVAGPTLGGALTSAFSWRAVFFPNVPIGAVALLLAFLMMPEVTIHRKRSVDVVGTLLVTTGLLALIYGLVEGQKYSWGRIKNVAAFDLGPIHAGLVSIPALLFISVALLVAFVIYEARIEEPLLPLSLFRDRNFSLGNLVALGVEFGIMGFYFPLTYFLQTVLGLSAVHAGLVLLPNALAIIASAPLSGMLTDKLNGKYVLFFGLAVFMIGEFLVGYVASLSSTPWTFLIPLVIIGLGMGCSFAPMTSMAMRNLAPTAAGAASGFLNTVRQVGFAMGSAVVGAVLADVLSTRIQVQAQHFAQQLPSPYRPAFIKGVSSFGSGGLDVGSGPKSVPVPSSVPPAIARQIQHLGQAAYNHAFLDAIHPAVYICLPFLAMAAIAALTMRGKRAVPAAVPQGVEPAVPLIPVAEPALEPVPMPVVMQLNMGGNVIVAPVIARHSAPRPLTPIRMPFLKAVGGGGGRYPIGKRPLSIGRLQSSDIVLDGPRVSRQHAQIIAHDGTVVVRDLNSVNGTFVNGERVERERQIHDGDVIAVGDDAFIFQNDIERARPRLVEMEDGHAEYPIAKTVVIGRLPSNDVVVNDPRVSRHHAELRFDKGEIVLRDLETLNGTYVNGQPVVGDWVMSPGDVVVFGSQPFVYRNEFAEAST